MAGAERIVFFSSISLNLLMNKSRKVLREHPLAAIPRWIVDFKTHETLHISIENFSNKAVSFSK